jgi:isocitrate lyase
MVAGLIRTIAVTCKSDNLGNLYNSFYNVEESRLENIKNGGVLINQNGKMVRSRRLSSNPFFSLL